MPPPNDTPSSARMTFGVELEFIVPCNQLPRCAARSWDTCRSQCGVAAIARRLAQATTLPVAAVCVCEDLWKISESCAAAPPGRHIRGCIAVFSNALRNTHGAEIARGQNPRYEYWRVMPEAGLESGETDPRGGPAEVGLEIASATLPYGEVVAGLPGFRQLIGALVGQHKLFINRECGLHVHVGGGPRGMPLLAAQRVVTLVAAIEMPLLARCVAKSRTRSDFWCPISDRSSWTNSDRCSVTSAMRRTVPDRLYAGCHVLTKLLENVWSAAALTDVCRLLRCGYKRLLDLAYRGPDSRTTTFEFRYPQMSFDVEFIRLWVELASTVVNIAFYDAASYRAVLDRVCDAMEGPEDVVVQKCLEALDLGGSVAAWAAKRADLQADADPSVDAAGELI